MAWRVLCAIIVKRFAPGCGLRFATSAAQDSSLGPPPDRRVQVKRTEPDAVQTGASMPWSRLRVPSWKKARRPLATDSAHELDDLTLPSRRQTQSDAASETAPRSRFYTSSVELPYQTQQPPDRRSSAEPAFWCAFVVVDKRCTLHRAPWDAASLAHRCWAMDVACTPSKCVKAACGPPWCDWSANGLSPKAQQRVQRTVCVVSSGVSHD